MKQELLTLPEHPSATPVFSGVRVVLFLVFCVMFNRSLFVLFGLFILDFVLSFFLRLTTSDYSLISSKFSSPVFESTVFGSKCIKNNTYQNGQSSIGNEQVEYKISVHQSQTRRHIKTPFEVLVLLVLSQGIWNRLRILLATK